MFGLSSICSWWTRWSRSSVKTACKHLRERRSVGGALADRLVEEDHAADVVGCAVRREQQLAVGAPVLLGRLDADRVEPLLDGAVALVGGENALARCDKGSCCLFELVHVGIIPARCSRRTAGGGSRGPGLQQSAGRSGPS